MKSLIFSMLCQTILAYLIGSLPTGLLLTRLVTGKDIRTLGSGNVGAANVGRVAGKKLGAAVLLLDFLKGALPACLALGWPCAEAPLFREVCVALSALASVLGHLYPLYFKGRFGGKGVATAGGCFAVIAPLALLGAVLVYLLTLRRWRIASLGSLAGASALPFLALLETGSWRFFLLGIGVAILIFVRHAANIRRLRRGTEPVWKAGKKEEPLYQGPEKG